MTTIKSVKKTCAVCNKTSEHRVTMSTNSFGSSDLDMRPPKMERFTIDTRVQCCPHCGYCNTNISDKIHGCEDIIKMKDYVKQMNDKNYSPVANAFLCHSIIQEKLGDFIKAGFASRAAAWVCDDEEAINSAILCRKRALNLFNMAKKNKEKIFDESGVDEALLIDLYRRSGEFEPASALCKVVLENEKAGDAIKKIALFQEKLICEKDISSHLIKEAFI